MDEDVRTAIAVIKVQLENLTDQLKRFISHLESEQRVTNNISKRVDLLQNQVDRIQDDKKDAKDSGRWKVETIVSILVMIGTYIGLILTWLLLK